MVIPPPRGMTIRCKILIKKIFNEMISPIPCDQSFTKKLFPPGLQDGYHNAEHNQRASECFPDSGRGHFWVRLETDRVRHYAERGRETKPNCDYRGGKYLFDDHRTRWCADER